MNNRKKSDGVNGEKMKSFEEALNIVLNQDYATGAEQIGLVAATGKILAEDIFSDVDMPPFNKSAVDGFACRMEDLAAIGSPVLKTFQVIETIPAGKIPEKKIGPGQCAKIMTGAMLPEGSNSVVMVEDTEEVDEQHIRINMTKRVPNICHRAEDIKSGERVIEKGEVITPAHIAVLAATGVVNPLVSKLPRVGVISTGDELVEPEFKPSLSRIRNSNGWQLMSQVQQVPANPAYFGIAADNPASLHDMIAKACLTSDVVLLTGGVSMGVFDYVPNVLNQAGFDILFHNIAIQPGKPTLFGRKKNQFLFGLPGNPVSSFVLFEMMVKPFLLRIMGNKIKPVDLELFMGVDFSRRQSLRKSMVPVMMKGMEAIPIEYHGSAHINAYTTANGIMMVEVGTTEIRKGEKVHVRPL